MPIKRGHTHTLISVTHETSFPPLMKLISIAQLHHTHTNRSKAPRAVYQSNISLLFPPYESRLSSHSKSFFPTSLFCCSEFQQLLHLHDGIYLRRHRRCSVLPPLIISRRPETRRRTCRETATQPDPRIPTLCPLWLAGEQALVLYSETQCGSVVVWRGQWGS